MVVLQSEVEKTIIIGEKKPIPKREKFFPMGWQVKKSY
jgi:hypothetical protein